MWLTGRHFVNGTPCDRFYLSHPQRKQPQDMMKQTLLLGAGLVVALGASAQSGREFPIRKMRSNLQQDPGVAVPYRPDRAVIWSDDFSNASTWTAGIVAGSDNDNWVVGTNGPSGPFAIPNIASTSAANGFALYDSDLFCGGNQNAFLAMANPIDLSAYPGAVLQFEQYFRAYYGECYVDVSVDGFNWTEFQVNADVAVNTSTTNPELYSLDITSAVANQANVWIRFRYYSSNTVHGQNAGCDYAWMVDDVSVIELEPYDLVLNYGVISHTGTGEEYGRVPTNQLNSDMELGAQVKNFGSLDQTGLAVQIVITDAASTTVLDQSFDLGDLAPGALADLDEFVPLSGLTPGIYDVVFTVSSNESGGDANPTDNTITRQFAVDDDEYALDGIDVYDSNELSSMGSTSFEGAADGLEILVYYELRQAATVYGVSAELANGSEANSAVIVSIFDTTQVFNDNLNSPIAQSDVVNVTTANIAAGRVVGLFVPPVDLPAGGYYASVRLLSAANEYDIFVLDDVTVPQPGNASLIYDPVDQTVFGNGNASAVRLQLNPTVGIQEQPELTGVSMFPNPTNGILRFNTTQSGNHAITVIDVVGNQVMTDRLNGNGTIDLSGLARGVYMVRVDHANGSMVQRVTLD